MLKKFLIFFVTLFALVPNVLADRLDEAVRASNFEQVNYLLVMKGNEVSQHRKDELVLLANETTLLRKRGKFPFGTLQDSLSIGKGLLASYIAYKCVRGIVATEFPNVNQHEVEIVWSILRYEFFGIIGVGSAGLGIYCLIQGLRSAHGRDLFAQAEQIEKRINEIQVAEVKS